MDKLDAMQVYVAVVDAHSFARAAEVLGQPRSTVSRVVKELEAWLGAQLLQRTTRKLSVTAEGRRYYEECKRLLAEMAAMEASFPGRSAQPAGRFKVGMPQSLARHCILPRIGEFLQQYPDLELILICRAGRWSPVWSRPLLIFPCRWSIRKTAICRRRCARFMTGAGVCCNPRTARPDAGASARLLAAHGLF